jgi:uncharacterized protein YjaG (DUF416 family)
MSGFDERALLGELVALPSARRIAFATAAATRQLGSYERFARGSGEANTERPREIAVQLWADIRVAEIDRTAWLARLDEVMGLLPEETGADWVGRALAEDALSSLAYAIRCLLAPEPQEAAWAARCAYEAADQAAIRVLGVQAGMPDTEATIESHGIVQRELARQRNDLSLPRADSVDEVQRNAMTAELLTDEEASALP